jgi:SNF2 family DNA or RNA helicase
MIALHSIWDKKGTLHIWGENSLPEKKPLKEKHPFSLSHERLSSILKDFSSVHDSAGRDRINIRLPSVKKGPLPSPYLIIEERQNSKGAFLKSWEIESLTLDPLNVFDFFQSIPSVKIPEISFGSSIFYWSEAAKFSLELLFHESFIPLLREENGRKSFSSSWTLLLTGNYFDKLSLLTENMPPLCRAMTEEVHPSELLLSFLNLTANAFIKNLFSPMPVKKGVFEKWKNSIMSFEPSFTLDDSNFSETYMKWIKDIETLDPSAPFRTCFKLEEPEGNGSDWSLSFHLQANDDRSLLMPADIVWKERGKSLTFLKRRFENPQERLLEDLGKACRIYPDLEESLKEACPVKYFIDTKKAYEFLHTSAPLLEQSGFGVLCPSWWLKPSKKPAVKLTVKSKSEGKTSSGLMGLDSILSYDWKIALGDGTMSQKEFEELARLKMPLVKIRGEWIELNPEDMEKALNYFNKKHKNREMTLMEALKLGLGQEESETGLKISGLEGEGMLKDFLEKFKGNKKITSLKTPENFKGKLRPYQERGLSWLAFLKEFCLGACLADDMGLGKTVQLIALLLHEKPSEPSLLVCPMTIVRNWQKEIERFAPSVKILIHHGSERLSGTKLHEEIKKYDMLITTYALIQKDEEDFSSIKWEYIILDEAQNIKNTMAKQTQSVKRLDGKYRIALTGTPVENRLSDLYSIMEFLNRGYLGSRENFRNTFSTPVEKYRDKDRAEELKRLVQPFILRRLKTDKSIIKDLPDKVEMKVYCNLTQEQVTLYEATVNEMTEKIDSSEGIERKGLVLSTIMKLKQICNHPAHFLGDRSTVHDRSGKVARLEEMIEEALTEGDKLLVFTQFAEMGHMLKNHLQEFFNSEILFLHGGTAKKQRDLMIERFQNEKKGPSIFILSLKAGGVGLNLTAANRVFHFDRWWNPSVENQATDRAFRIGQKKNVLVHKFISSGTLEENIDMLIEDKKELAENIVCTGENWLTELTGEELKSLFTLRKERI